MEPVSSFDGHNPEIDAHAFVDISARVIGEVGIEEGASVWPMAVIRADSAPIRVGQGSAILDLALLEAPEGFPVEIGPSSIVSHSAVVHGATVETRALVGIGAIVLDGAVVSSGSIVAAGAVVPPKMRIPPDSLVMGAPARVVRETTAEERRRIAEQVEELLRKSRMYLAELSR